MIPMTQASRAGHKEFLQERQKSVQAAASGAHKSRTPTFHTPFYCFLQPHLFIRTGKKLPLWFNKFGVLSSFDFSVTSSQLPQSIVLFTGIGRGLSGVFAWDGVPAAVVVNCSLGRCAASPLLSAHRLKKSPDCMLNSF